MNILGVVCARGNNERLPFKHLLAIGGLSIVSNVVRGAIGSALSRTVLSTDLPLIATTIGNDLFVSGTLPSNCGIPTRMRPPELASAESSIEDALLDALGWAEAAYDTKYDAVAFLPGNIVGLSSELITCCVAALLRSEDATAVMSIREVFDVPEWTWLAKDSGYILPAFPELMQKGGYRMQDIPKRYIATGAVNIVRAYVLRANKSKAPYAWMGDRIIGVIDKDTMEIHDQQDYEVAKALWEPKYESY